MMRPLHRYTLRGSHTSKPVILPSASFSVMVRAAAMRRFMRSQMALLQSAERGVNTMRSSSSGSALTVMKLHECV